jgi:hypothetical protein
MQRFVVRRQQGARSVASVTPFTGSFETCAIIGERPDAVILAFAGTDPDIWQNLVTDGAFRIDPTTGTHDGFRKAAVAANDVRGRKWRAAEQSDAVRHPDRLKRFFVWLAGQLATSRASPTRTPNALIFQPRTRALPKRYLGTVG